MPRYIYAPAALTSNGQTQRVTYHSRQSGGMRYFDLYTVDGSDNISVGLSNGVGVTDTSGNITPFAGPDDVASMWQQVGQTGGGAARTQVTAARVSAGNGGAPAASSGASPTSIVRTKSYNSSRAIYNAKPSNLRRFNAAMGDAIAGTGLCDTICIGDSTSNGYLTTARNTDAYPIRAASALSQRTGAALAGQWVTPYWNVATLDSRWTVSGTAGQTWQTPNTGVVSTSATAGAVYVSTNAGTVAEVLYSQFADPFTVKIDAGSAIGVTPTGVGAFGVYRITGLANTVHTITLASTSFASSNGLLFQAARVRQTSGVSVSAWGYNGMMATDWYQNGAVFHTDFSIVTLAPALVVIQLGTNEGINSITSAVFTAALTGLATQHLTTSDVILSMPPNPSAVDISAFRTAAYAVADALDIPVIDQRDRLGTYLQANADGLMADVFHQNTKGSALMGLTLAAALA